jgi:hypothetical protein
LNAIGGGTGPVDEAEGASEDSAAGVGSEFVFEFEQEEVIGIGVEEQTTDAEERVRAKERHDTGELEGTENGFTQQVLEDGEGRDVGVEEIEGRTEGGQGRLGDFAELLPGERYEEHASATIAVF